MILHESISQVFIGKVQAAVLWAQRYSQASCRWVIDVRAVGLDGDEQAENASMAGLIEHFAIILVNIMISG